MAASAALLLACSIGEELSFDPIVHGSREFTRMLALERAQWRKVIQAAGITGG